MKKLFTLLFALFMATAINAETVNTVKLDGFVVNKGGTATVKILVNIAEAIENNVFECYISLPEGLSFEGDKANASFGDAIDVPVKNQGIVITRVGELFFNCYAADLAVVEDGVVAQFDIKASDTFESGDINVHDILLGDEDPDPITVTVQAGVPTAISTVASAADSAIYNLSGMRVAEPAKGIYIQNGKKFVK